VSWTYSDLVSKVAGYLNRSDLASKINDAILLFESDYNTRQGVWRRRRVFSFTTVAGDDALVVLPADYERMDSLYRVGAGELPVRSIIEVNRLRAGIGEPQVAAVYPDDKLLLGPTPDAAYDYEMLYYPRLEGLSPTQTTNWLISKYPHIYLYGVLAFMMDYIRDDARKAAILGQYEASLASLNSSTGVVAIGNMTMEAV
jgi:hypothetical protein